MNPYIQRKEEVEALKSRLSIVNYNHKRESKNLMDKIHEIDELCTHKNEEGNCTWEYTGQDAGSGRSEFECLICKKTR